MGKSSSTTTFQDLPPHLLYKILIQGSLSVLDLVHVEATCYAFRAAPGLLPLRFKSIVEIAVVDLCNAHPLYSLLPPLHRKQLLRRCGCNWKMLLRYLQSTEQANGMVSTPKGKVQVAAGKYHSLVLARDKGVFACGSELPFLYPNDKVLCETSGLFVHVMMPQNVLVTQVASSHQHVAFITSSGELYTYGDNKSGCCGLGEANHSGIDVEEANQTVIAPKLVTALQETRCKQVSAGVNFTMVLTVEGHVYTCGKNAHGQLGHGDANKRHVFTKIETLDSRVVQISAGAAHALAVTQNGDAFSWGYGANWCLGHNNVANELQPKLIQLFKDDDVFLISVSAGYEHSVALDSKGQVYTWGRGYCGALGHGHEGDVGVPQSVATLSEVRAVQVCSKKRRTFVLSDDGRLYGFGWMGFGSLGLSRTWNSEKVLIPSVLDSLKDHHICQVSAGLYHTLAVTNKGTILGFGDNDKGPLGVSRATSCPEPIEVVNLDHLQPSSPFEHAVASIHL
ncbi:hypothetical protein GOP47_0029445 [Adiantum capillus-veneris]|nr:hypothetical protein GOP47_0029445 [Adiantum capillus-veneris]